MANDVSDGQALVRLVSQHIEHKVFEFGGVVAVGFGLLVHLKELAILSSDELVIVEIIHISRVERPLTRVQHE